MSQLEIQTLGSFQVILDGVPVQGFDSDKVRLLLVYLAVESPQPFRREALATMFWPEAPTSEGRSNLRWALSNLRKVIGDRQATMPFIKTSRQTIQRNPDANICIDYADFIACAEENSPSLDHLERAAALYRDVFLCGINPKDSLPLDEWLLLRREYLARLLVEILDKLIQLYMQQGDYLSAIPHARRRVNLEPWQEQGHRDLMRLLAATGQRSAALLQYKNCRDILQNNLGVNPEKETTALYKKLQQEKLPSTDNRQNNFPNSLTPLIGRERELGQIRSWLGNSQPRLIIITGAGGTGKTHLALESASLQSGKFLHGIHFIGLGSLTSYTDIVPAIAEGIKFSFTPGEDLHSQLLEYLRDKEMLLILDNFEHLLDGVDIVVQILSTASKIKILSTSRVGLNIPGEQRLPLSGLDLPEKDTPILQSSAIKLFVEAARRLDPQLDLSPENLAASVDICQYVEGLPLGILLAASWVNVLAPVEIATEIRKTLALFETEWDGLARQHRSLQTVMLSSWNLLSQDQQITLAQLSVIQGDFTRQVACSITGCTLATLQGLVNFSFLNRSMTGRFHLHELLRRFSAEQLKRSPPQEQLARFHHSNYFLTQLFQYGQELKGPQQKSALAQMRADHSNFITAWEWAANHKKVEQLLSCVDGLFWYLEWRVRYSEGYRLCYSTLSAFDADSANKDALGLSLRAHLLAWKGHFCWRLGKKEAARETLIEAQTSVDQLARKEVSIDFVQGLVWKIQGRLLESSDRPAARRYYKKSLHCFRSAKALWETADLLSALGSVAWNLGNYNPAAEYHRQALEMRRKLGDLRGVASSSMALGTTLLYQGKLKQAEMLISEGSHLRRQIGDRLGIADSLRNLGFTCMMMGDFDQAVELLSEAVALYEGLGLHYGLEMSMLAAAFGHQGDFPKAHQWNQRGLEAARQTGYRRALGFSLLTLGELAIQREDITQANQALDESLGIYKQINQRDELCRVQIAQAVLACKVGNLHQGKTSLQHARQIILTQQAFIPLLYYIPAQAMLFKKLHEEQKSEQWMQAISPYWFVVKSKWFDDLLEMDLNRSRNKLPQGNLPTNQLWQLFESIK